jgi:hypothetical protein
MKLTNSIAALVLLASAAACSRRTAGPDQPVALAAPEKNPSIGMEYKQPTAQEIQQARLDWLRSRDSKGASR